MSGPASAGPSARMRSGGWRFDHVTPIVLPLPEPDGPLELRIRNVATGLGYLLEGWTLRGAHGDTVPADVYLPADQEARAVVVVLHGRRGSRKVPYVRGAAKRWSRDGLAVVAIDAPYHGERALDQIPDLARNEPFLAQTVGDLRRLCTAIGADGRLANLPVGYVGFSMGVLVGVPFMAVDRRVWCGVFAVGGATGTGATDPATYAPLIRERPVLLVNADGDEFFDQASVTTLYQAFGGSQELLQFPGTHGDWRHPARRYRAMFDFLRAHLAGDGPEGRR
jgi:dienelactone hydrolase